MEINEFLDQLGITRTELSIGLGMENPSSFGRYKEFEDFKKIRNKEYKNKLSFLFNIQDIEEDKIDIEKILNGVEEKENFKERLNILKKHSDKNQKLKNLEINNKKLLYQNISIIEDIMIDQEEAIVNSLNIFLKMIKQKNEKIEMFLLYLGKMNMEVAVNEYQYDEIKQKELEALFFVILNDKLRKREIDEKLKTDKIYKEFEERIEIRKELFEEKSIKD